MRKRTADTSAEDLQEALEASSSVAADPQDSNKRNPAEPLDLRALQRKHTAAPILKEMVNQDISLSNSSMPASQAEDIGETIPHHVQDLPSEQLNKPAQLIAPTELSKHTVAEKH